MRRSKTIILGFGILLLMVAITAFSAENEGVIYVLEASQIVDPSPVLLPAGGVITDIATDGDAFFYIVRIEGDKEIEVLSGASGEMLIGEKLSPGTYKAYIDSATTSGGFMYGNKTVTIHVTITEII